MTQENPYEYMRRTLNNLEAGGNLRRLHRLEHDGRYVTADGRRMLNLSSNDYLGLAADIDLRREFLAGLTPETFVPSSSSSRLLTGNCPVYEELETELARLYGREAALVFNCGYHANTGILPAVADADTLILADKLVHASLIDGLKLGTARYLRYRHNDMKHLERILHEYAPTRKRTVIVTESIFSMDGDEAPLRQLVELKKRYPGTLLYVDEAHAFGVRGRRGLGCAEEQGVTADIDFLMGTFGKAAGVDTVRPPSSCKDGQAQEAARRTIDPPAPGAARMGCARPLVQPLVQPHRPPHCGRKRQDRPQGRSPAAPRVLPDARASAYGA